MDWLIWTGASVSLLGVIGLFWCVWAAAKAKRAGLEDAALRARLQEIVAWNLGALAISTIGLMLVILGIFLS